MIETLTEYIANKTVRVASADAYFHNFILTWNNEVCNVVWDNTADCVVSINGYGVDLLIATGLPEEELDTLDNVLRKHLLDLDKK